jgi:hypothetical protein
MKRPMKKIIQTTLTAGLLLLLGISVYAGNPDRQGEAGAGELLFNPWARSAGIHTMNTSSISGVEAMRLNVAGIGRINNKEVLIGNTRLYEGSTLRLNALGFVSKTGTNGAFGITLTSVDFGEIPITTVDQPEGTSATYSPSFFNLGVGYSYTYGNKISVGILFRIISESLPTVSAFGMGVDAGVQYVSGEKDNFKLGISLRNIGSPLKFSGQGLGYQVSAPDGSYEITLDQRSEEYELPSMLNIGISYDYYFADNVFVRGIGNFTSNAFSRDQIGVGAELFLFDKFALRGGYRYELDGGSIEQENIYTGLSAGASIDVPINKAGSSKFGVDYAYRATDPFRGTHNVAIRLGF